MFLKWLRKDEQGSIMVIVAVAMVALLGFAGLAVDYGSMAMTKQELQNAADAAALAAGQDRMNGLPQATANATADSFIRANGYHPGDGVTVSTITHGSDTVTVEIQTQKKVALSGALTGRNTTTISAKAVAEVTTAFGEFPYALFAADTMEDDGSGVVVVGQGSDGVYISGNVHSNTTINMKKAHVTNGIATAVEATPTIASGSKSKTLVIDMPRADSLISYIKASSPYVVNGDWSGTLGTLVQAAYDAGHLVDNTINIYVRGSVSFGGESHNGNWPVNLLVEGSIDFGGSPLTSTEDTPIVFLSENGSITVNGQGTSGKNLYAIIFAPKGNVTFNGNKVHIFGSIIARNITKHGGSFHVTYNNHVDNHLPQGKVRLIA